MKIRWPAMLAVFVLPTIACAQTNPAEEIDQSVKEQRVRAAIDEGNSRYIEAFGKADAAGVASVYDPDGARLYPNGSIIRGRETIQADVQQFVGRATSDDKLDRRLCFRAALHINGALERA